MYSIRPLEFITMPTARTNNRRGLCQVRYNPSLFKSPHTAGMIVRGLAALDVESRRSGVPAVIDGQVPCSGWGRHRVRLETEQPICFIQVPWIAWPSMTAGRGEELRIGSWRVVPRFS